ncbi:4Fe-4S binding protein (plasmid) [Ralstonia wenshanensis]|uniref:4Fe-4S binding protein n=1 Tax=Ralstonia TaxID=48736 RepID=UPI001E385F81|nr:4Fe-4S binding protein [Ralstonia wenshanensis]UGS89181.1 4Fe-4S binding protein [Ralstonia wenshanensis]
MKHLFSRLAVIAATCAMDTSALAGISGMAYEAPLPAGLSTDPNLCAMVPCTDVLPGASSFSPRKGHPPYVEGYRDVAGKRQLVGYAFLSTDIVDMPGYSGKPIITLMGMDAHGVITGVKVLRHSEPILLLGIPETQLTHFTSQYVGKFVGGSIEIGKSHAVSEGAVELDAISGATVTVMSENQVILRSGKAVAEQAGIIAPKRRAQAKFTQASQPLSWKALLDQGAVQRLTVHPEDVGLQASGQPYVDMVFGDISAPVVGRSILGDANYASLMSSLKPGEHAIFIASNGTESFKGSGFVRGGIFDRIQVAQDTDTFTFRDLDYQNLYGIRATGAPEYRESGIFIIRSPGFSSAYPWKLVFLANKLDAETGAKTFTSFDQEYWLPADELVGGRPQYDRPAPPWLQIWKARAVEIGLFALLLIGAGAVYACRDTLVRRSRRKDKRWVSWPKYALWTTSIGFAGFHLMAQPSITQVLTWFHAILFKWRWDLFLSDPFIFLFWWFIIISVFFWGRGMFCGWLCPYGSLSEILYKVGGKLGLARFQFQLPKALHDKLKWIKYGVFAGLLGMSFYSMGTAEKLAEIEPFKTTFLVGVWNRTWPFVTFWSVLAVAALFIERPFCKYLCPLGASLAIPSTFRWWGLKRKQECGPCRACEAGCGSQAIGRDGKIDQRECLLCLDCMVMYYDDHACPPLVKERKHRTSAGLKLTPIGADGYYIPIQPVLSAPPKPAAPAPASLPLPPVGTLARLRRELTDHLFPWNRQFLSHPLFFRAAGIGLAVLVTWAWLLGAGGRLGAGIVLGWWLAWSAYEWVMRMACKPYVKEGAWWGYKLRTASWADMAAYVGMKNLLIGAGLFLAMKGVGVLPALQSLPQLKWLY